MVPLLPLPLPLLLPLLLLPPRRNEAARTSDMGAPPTHADDDDADRGICSKLCRRFREPTMLLPLLLLPFAGLPPRPMPPMPLLLLLLLPPMPKPPRPMPPVADAEAKPWVLCASPGRSRSEPHLKLWVPPWRAMRASESMMVATSVVSYT